MQELLDCSFFKDILPVHALGMEWRRAGLLKVKLIFQHTRYKKIMSVGVVKTYSKSSRTRGTEGGTSENICEERKLSSITLTETEVYFMFISCFWLLHKYSAATQINETTEGGGAAIRVCGCVMRHPGKD